MRRRTLSLFGLALGGLGLLAGCSGDSNAAPESCSTGSAWLDGDEGSPEMHPGGDCISCHRSEGEGPRFTVAGTVMAAKTDNTDCNGVSAATVVLEDAAGQTLTLKTNAAGNFYSTKSITFPYRAKVVVGDKEVAMGDAQSTGDCASCHTATAGRIVPPM